MPSPRDHGGMSLALSVWMSTRRLGYVALLLCALPPTAWARPVDRAGNLPLIRSLSPHEDVAFPADPALFSAAQTGTTWFGGTVWAADSMRWEAIQGQLWTFDSGVGSSIVPPGGPETLSAPTRDWVNPYKQPGLHATLEGWVGFDETYSEIPDFRRVSAFDPRWEGPACVGSGAGLGGEFSFWAGVFPDEADSACYQSGRGYGNDWLVCIEHPFTYTGGEVGLSFTFFNDIESGFDFTTVYVDTSGVEDPVEVVSYTGLVSGVANLSLSPGVELPETTPTVITIRFCVSSDGTWSDQDGLYPTSCGAFAVDDISVTGDGIAHLADFEMETIPDADGEQDGWMLSSPPEPGLGGEWAELVHVSDLPPTITPCACALEDTVLVFQDDSGGHGGFQDNLAASPWIDLEAAGLMGSPGKILRADVYSVLPLLDFVFVQCQVQWYPYPCPATGKLVVSPWTASGFIFQPGGGSLPFCTLPGDPLGFQVDFSAFIPPSAQQVRIAFGVINQCRFFYSCTGLTNSSPWFDNIGFGVYGVPGAPFIKAVDVHRPQDNFPENGTVLLGAAGRVDCARIQGASSPEIGTTLGDTLVVTGAMDNAEVFVHFQVRPGPGIDDGRFDAWWESHSDSPYEPGFKLARCDTAETGSGVFHTGLWMTAYHESDPNFSGSDRDSDPSDIAPGGGAWRLANDIFPDDLFTPGSRIEIFYTANTVGQTVQFREPPAPRTYEMEILPSSMAGDGSSNCVLYVDRAGGDAQVYVEEALLGILGAGSANAEGTNWDRFDVNSPSTKQMAFGRPAGTEYGATGDQLLEAYNVILWNTGSQNAFNLSQEDANALVPWLTSGGYGVHKLYMSGDGLVYSALNEAASEPSARHLVEDLAGATLRVNCSAGAFRLADCPVSGSLADGTPCADLLPVVDAPVAGSGAGRTVTHQGQGNGCPSQRSFDVLYPTPPESGTSEGDERYETPIKGARFSSVVAAGHRFDTPRYRTVVDGVSVHLRRDAGTPCDYGLGGTQAVAERHLEVLNYFGLSAGTLCEGATTGVGDDEIPGSLSKFALSGLVPNPLSTGRDGRIRFSLAREGAARIEIHDLQGRRVRTVFDAVAPAGPSEAIWDGRDETGTPVGSGVYFLRLQAGGGTLSSRVVVLGRRGS